MNYVTPLPVVQKWTNTIPDVWADLNVLAEKYLAITDMENNAELHAALSIVESRAIPTAPQNKKANAAFLLYSCAKWRENKVVYAYDETLADELIRQADEWNDEEKIPMDALLHPPYEMPFISCPGAIVSDAVGFFPFILHDVEQYPILYFCVVRADGSSFCCPLMLSGETIDECVRSSLRKAYRAMQGTDGRVTIDRERIRRLINLYLYICCANADVPKEPEKTYRPRTAGTPIRDKFREVKVYPTGVVIGSTLRRAKTISVSAGEHTRKGSPKRPHTRRGHWHNYWVGSKSKPNARKLILKWIHPVLIGGKENTDITTVHPVK